MKASMMSVCLVLFALTACSEAPPDNTVFDDQLETMDRARQVEDVLQERAADLEQRLEESDDDPPQ